MKTPPLIAVVAAMGFSAGIAAADTFTIGGVSFNQANSVTTAVLVDGGHGLRDYSNRHFGRASEAYLRSLDEKENEFAKFDRSKSIGRLIGRSNRKSSDVARHLTFPETGDTAPFPNRDRVVLELTWGGKGLPNGPGGDLAVYETAVYEPFGLAVRKAGSDVFSEYRYRFAESEDKLHNAHVAVFDLSDFGIKESEMITAIRIINVFNSAAPQGADKVDDPSGQGKLLRAGEPGYDDGYPLLDKPDGREFPIDRLNADIVYVVGLHDIEPVRK